MDKQAIAVIGQVGPGNSYSPESSHDNGHEILGSGNVPNQSTNQSRTYQQTAYF